MVVSVAELIGEWRLGHVTSGRCDLCGLRLADAQAWRHWRAGELSCFDFTACTACADKLLEEGT